MKSGIPSLNSLVIFEKAASLLCFKTTAESLYITAPAVSHQIRTLEKDLGVPLFKRLNRSVELTEAGELYYKQIAPAMIQLRDATSQVSTARSEKFFRINCIPFIASSVLIPNIRQFMNQHVDLNVDIKSLPSGEGLESGAVSAEIRLHNDENPALHYEKLVDVQVSPICSNDYLKLHQDICTDLSGHCLIKLPSKTNVWNLWSNKFKTEIRKIDEVLVDNYQSVLSAVHSNMGIGMGYFSNSFDLYKGMDVVELFPNSHYKLGDLYLVYSKYNAKKPEFNDFKNWLLTLFKADIPGN